MIDPAPRLRRSRGPWGLGRQAHFVLLFFLGLGSTAIAQDAVQSDRESATEATQAPDTVLYSETRVADPETQLQTLRVTGMQAEELSQPAAPKRITKETLEEARLTDVGRALRQAPGVYVRDEEGQGLRPNIGLRGTNPDRSKKIVIMQDEILSGPAPYSAPAAYFTPSLNLAEELQIYKGFSALLYGPNSIGGAINYTTRGIPSRASSSVDFGYGSFGVMNTKLFAGGPTSWGGYVLEGVRLSSDGFKQLDGGGNTGFYRNDFSAKLKFDLPDRDSKVQFIELRLGYGAEDSHESYLGLSDADFQTSPYRRYVSSALDEMKWTQSKVHLEYNRQVGETGLMKLTLYQQDFHRDWYRLDRFGDPSKNMKDVLKDPTGTNSLFAGILRGTEDSSSVGGANGQLILANNDRRFVSRGLQMIWNGDVMTTGMFSHQLKVLERIHQDQIDRDHTFDTYEMSAGKMLKVAERGIGEFNQDWAWANTFGIQDDISFGPYVVTLMGRFESIHFRYRDEILGSENERKDSFFVPGAALLRKVNDNISLKVSLNQAVTASGLDSAGSEKREESLNLEFGVKYLSDSRTTEADVVVFKSDYSNLTGTCTASTGCASAQLDQQFNGGQANMKGIEARVGHSLQAFGAWFPLQLNLTWIQGQFANEFVSTGAEWGVGTVRAGDPLPYVPEIQYTLVIGHEFGKFKQAVNIQYQGEMYDQSVTTGREKVPAFGVVDWNGLYNWSKDLQIFAKAENLAGNDYLVALRPYGARPGKRQTAMFGFKASF